MEQVYEAFCLYLKNKKRISANTLQSYRHDIYEFLVFSRSEGVREISKVDTKLIERYLHHLHNEKLSDATIVRNLSCLRTFFKYLVSDRMITFDPTVGIKSVKAVQKLPDILTGDEVERLLMQPDLLTAKGKRDKAMLETLYATGMRVSELLSLTFTDVNLEMGYIITAQNTKKERFIPLYPLAIRAIKDYLEFSRPTFFKENTPSEYLFLNVSGQAMSRQGFWKIIKRYTKTAEIDKDITPITLRHSFATHLLKNGADLNTVKDMLGHSTITSTKMYAKLLKNQYMSVYEHCHPRAKLR